MAKKVLSCWYLLILYLVFFIFKSSFFTIIATQSVAFGMFFLFLSSLAPDPNPMTTAPVYLTPYVSFQCGVSVLFLIPVTIHLFTVSIPATIVLTVAAFVFNGLLQSWATFLFVSPTYLMLGDGR